MASSLGSCLIGTLYRMDFELSLFLLRGETRKTPGKTTTRWMVDPGGRGRLRDGWVVVADGSYE